VGNLWGFLCIRLNIPCHFLALTVSSCKKLT
jgi:hypothetical protein